MTSNLLEGDRESGGYRIRGASEDPTRLTLPRARAFWFGNPERPLFGWYHAPALNTARGAVVLCNAFGHESMVGHRTQRRLAQRLAAEGFAALRFDYDGTGDSAGSDQDPARVHAWLESIQRAVREVTTLSGATQVALVGTRLGALLAVAQAERSMVDALVLIAPPRSGRTWLREMRVLNAVKNTNMAAGAHEDLGIAGFLMGEDTRNAVSAIDMHALRQRPADAALIIARDDLPGVEPELVRQLAKLGVHAELSTVPGYAAAMPPDPFKSVVPLEMLEQIANWLGERFPAPAPRSVDFSTAPASGRPTVTPMALPTPTTREQVADVGGLFGILSEPVVPSALTGTGVVLLNIGANYHIGSNRMYVRMARAWAEQGLQVLRMDFSGMGDSPVVGSGKENDVYAARFMAEARSAIDFMQAQGAKRFVLIGLCSGAYVAYHTAIGDPRVSGLVMINPMTFHWNEGDSLEVRIRKSFKTTTQYKRSLFAARTWLRIVKGEVGVAAIAGELTRRSQRRASREIKSLLAKVTGGIAEATDVERGFRQLCARGTQCLLIFGAEDGGIDLIEEHLGRDGGAMRHVGGFRMEVMAGPDHTFTPLESQDELLARLSAHLTGTVGGPPR